MILTFHSVLSKHTKFNNKRVIVDISFILCERSVDYNVKCLISPKNMTESETASSISQKELLENMLMFFCK